MSRKFNSLELFAGCGGLLDGFEKSNFYNTIAVVEWEKVSCNTLIKRLKDRYGYKNAEHKVLRFDIQQTKKLINGWDNDYIYGSNNGLKSLIGNRKVDIIIGGPPCQAYSLAGRIQDKNGMKNDYRNYLFESYLEIVKEFNPRLIIFENVTGMLSAKPDGTNITDKVKEGFNNLGFDVIDNFKNAVIDMSEYGVPQKRKRVILLGLNKHFFRNNKMLIKKFYKEILPKYKTSKTPTVYNAIHDLPALYPSETDFWVGRKKFSHKPHETNINFHCPRYHNKRDIQIFKTLAYDIYSRKGKYSNIEELKKFYAMQTGKTSNIHKYYVLRWNKPSNTIPAHLKKDGLRHIHPDHEQARTITVREAARLQTFDDNYEFTGSMTSAYEQAGNAVPPLFSEKLAHAVYELLIHP